VSVCLSGGIYIWLLHKHPLSSDTPVIHSV